MLFIPLSRPRLTSPLDVTSPLASLSTAWRARLPRLEGLLYGSVMKKGLFDLAWKTNLHVIAGEQLESVHVARQRAQAAHDIVSYWNQFSRGDTSKLEALRKEGREGRQAVAVLLRRLNAVSKDLDVAGSSKVR